MKQLLRSAGLLAASLGFALLLGEGLLRLTGAAFNGSFFLPDAERGWALRPNTEGWLIGETKNYLRINSDGLHDREHALAKPPGTLRIAVLGDSCAESAEQPIEKAFSSVMERDLARCQTSAGKKVEVINFGVSGYGTAQELLTLRSHVWKYNPDVVLLAFYAGNDIFNNHRDFNPSVGADQCPYFTLQSGQLVLDTSYQRSPGLGRSAMRSQAIRATIVNHSRLVQLFYSVVNNYRQRATEQQIAAKARAVNSGAAQVREMDDEIYLPPSNSKLEDAWRVTEALLATMNREVKAHGAEFWIVNLWTSRQVAPETAARQKFCARLGVENLSYPDLRIQALAAKEEIPLILLAPPVARYTQEHNVAVNGGVLLPAGVGHFNELGHRLAGDIIAAELCSRSARLGGSPGAPSDAAVACPAPVASTR